MGKHFIGQEFEAWPGEIGRKAPAEWMRHPDACRPYMFYGLFRGEDSVEAVGFTEFLDGLRPLAYAPRILLAQPASVGAGIVKKVGADLIPGSIGIPADETSRDSSGARIDK